MTQSYRVRPRLVPNGLLLASAFVLAAFLPGAGALQAQDNQRDPFPPGDVANSVETADFQEPAAHVSIVDGRALLQRDGETSALDENEPLIEGDRVSTERGRAELLFPDGSALSLDELTTIEVLAPAFVRVVSGQIALTIDRRVPPNTYRVDANGAVVWVRSSGEFRVSSSGRDGDDLRVMVIRGLAEVETPRDRVLVRAGYETLASGRSTALATYPVPVTTWTAFDRWVEASDRSRYSQSASTYLPTELRAYSGVLDNSGDWRYDASNGYVWYPRVDVDWQPYSVGRWSSVGSYGWTWIGVGRWSWPTHHYGRWGYSGARWYWVPGRRWAPAWVTWASAPGYVAWCPVGYVGGPRYGIGISVSHSSWRGWSAVPSRSFSARAVVVHRDRVPFNRVNERFVVRSQSPVRPTVRANATQVPRNLPLPPNTAQPRAGYGVGTAPRLPSSEPRAARGTSSIESPRQPQPGAASPRFPSRTVAPSPSAPEAPRQRPVEQAVSPRFPSRTVSPGASAPETPRPRPVEEGLPRTRAGSVNERPAAVVPPAGGYARTRRPAPEQVAPPRTQPNPGAGRVEPEPRTSGFRRAGPSREPAAAPEPATRQAPPPRPETVERPTPRQRGGGSEGAPAGGRAAPRAEPRSGSAPRSR